MKIHLNHIDDDKMVCSKDYLDLEVCIGGVDTVEATINDTEIYEQVYPERYK